MRILIITCLTLFTVGCSSQHAVDRQLNEAYSRYEAGDCGGAMLALSQAERRTRGRGEVQPEISLLRGQCLERQGLYVDAAQTYRFIRMRYPASEYAYRAAARLETLRQLGHYEPAEPAISHPARP